MHFGLKMRTQNPTEPATPGDSLSEGQVKRAGISI